MDLTSFKYGFDKLNEDLFDNREAELHEISDIDPSKVTVQDRLEKLNLKEDLDFDPEAYLADYFELEMVKPKIDYEFKLCEKKLDEYKDMSMK